MPIVTEPPPTAAVAALVLPPAKPVRAVSVPAVNPWIVTVSVMLATFIEILDTTVVNVSIPHMAGNLSATVE